MPVMNIGEVAVAMGERDVFVNMVVWLMVVHGIRMLVLMVRIVCVRVSMLQGLVPVAVRVPLRQV